MITVVFTRPRHRTLISILIRWFTSSRMSHTGLGIEMNGIKMILDAEAEGVVPHVRKRFERTDRIMEEYEILADVEPGLRHATEHIGDKYDFGGIIGFAYVKILQKWFKTKVKNPTTSSTAVWCSEFVLHVDHEKKIPEWRDLDPESTDPEMLRRRCIQGCTGDAPSFRKL